MKYIHELNLNILYFELSQMEKNNPLLRTFCLKADKIPFETFDRKRVYQ